MKTIYKYQLQTTDEQVIELPKYYQILSVQIQNGVPCMWVLVDPENEPDSTKIRIYGTGHQFDLKAWKFIDTYQLQGGALVFHVFENGTI